MTMCVLRVEYFGEAIKLWTKAGQDTHRGLQSWCWGQRKRYFLLPKAPFWFPEHGRQNRRSAPCPHIAAAWGSHGGARSTGEVPHFSANKSLHIKHHHHTQTTIIRTHNATSTGLALNLSKGLEYSIVWFIDRTGVHVILGAYPVWRG